MATEAKAEAKMVAEAKATAKAQKKMAYNAVMEQLAVYYPPDAKPPATPAVWAPATQYRIETPSPQEGPRPPPIPDTLEPNSGVDDAETQVTSGLDDSATAEDEENDNAVRAQQPNQDVDDAETPPRHRAECCIVQRWDWCNLSSGLYLYVSLFLCTSSVVMLLRPCSTPYYSLLPRSPSASSDNLSRETPYLLWSSDPLSSAANCYDDQTALPFAHVGNSPWWQRRAVL